jgi:hypothetical protein
MMKCKTSQLVEKIKPFILADLPIYIHGKTGIGKNDITETGLLQWLNETYSPEGLGPVEKHYFPLSHYDSPVDIIGLPHFERDEKTGLATTKFAPFYDGSNLSSYLPIFEDGKMHAIWFDEVSHASISLLHMMYQIVLVKRVGPFTLAKNCRFIMLGNVRADKGGDKNLPKPLENRMVHIEVEMDSVGFLEYTGIENWNPTLRSFLNWCQSNDPEAFHDVHDINPAFPTPRSWKMLNQTLDANPELSAEQIEDVASACVGIDRGRKFAGYMKTKLANLPTLTQIAANPRKVKVPKEPDLQYTIANAISNGLRKQEKYRKDIDAFVIYLERLEPDHASRIAYDWKTNNYRPDATHITEKLQKLVMR